MFELIDYFRSRYPLLAVPAGVESVLPSGHVTMLLPDNGEVAVTEGSRVVRGEPLCREPHTGTFASVCGTVERIMPWEGGPRGWFTAVIIAVEPSDEYATLAEPVGDFHAADPVQLREMADLFGFHIPMGKGPVLFTALDEDIDRVSNRWCLEKEFDRIVAGLWLLKKLCSNRKIIIAVPRSLTVEHAKRCAEYGECVTVQERFPDTMSELVIRRHPLLRCSEMVPVVDARRLVSIVMSLQTGRAQTEMLVSVRVGRTGLVRLFQVPVGMPVSDLPVFTSLENEAVTEMVLGGEMTGVALDSAGQPFVPGHDALLVVQDHDIAAGENVSCVNCGRCFRVCPVGLRVDLIAKNIEFRKIGEAARLGLALCVDCGMCSAVCIVRRPLAHFCAFGKGEIATAAKTGSDV
jgi:electron transport complex protein RnfC